MGTPIIEIYFMNHDETRRLKFYQLFDNLCFVNCGNYLKN